MRVLRIACRKVLPQQRCLAKGANGEIGHLEMRVFHRVRHMVEIRIISVDLPGSVHVFKMENNVRFTLTLATASLRLFIRKFNLYCTVL